MAVRFERLRPSTARRDCYFRDRTFAVPGSVSVSEGVALGVESPLGGARLRRMSRRSVKRGDVLRSKRLNLTLKVEGVSPRGRLGILVDAECSVIDGRFKEANLLTANGEVVTVDGQALSICSEDYV